MSQQADQEACQDTLDQIAKMRTEADAVRLAFETGEYP
jgi:hypothetical protein